MFTRRNMTITAVQPQITRAGDLRLRDARASGPDISGVFAFTPCMAVFTHVYDEVMGSFSLVLHEIRFTHHIVTQLKGGKDC